MNKARDSHLRNSRKWRATSRAPFHLRAGGWYSGLHLKIDILAS
jgi:hypothetical protein